MPARKPKGLPKIKQITPDMYWEAPQSPRTSEKGTKDSQANLEMSNAPGASQELPDRFQGQDGRWHWTAKGYRKWVEEQRLRKAQRELASKDQHKRERAELVVAKANLCPFCHQSRETHPETGCPEYDRLLRQFSANRGPLRPGVPWEWVVEYYAKQGKVPPLPREMYD